MSRALRLSAVIAAAILVALVLDTTAWWLLTSRLITGAAAWQQARAAEGYRVSAGVPRRAGWPLRAIVALPDMVVAAGTPGSTDAVAWQTDAVQLVYVPWRPKEVTVGLDGAQNLQLGMSQPITVQVETLDLVVPLDPSGQASGFAATARQLQLPLPSGRLSLDTVSVVLGPADVRLSLSALTLPSPGLPLGVTIGSLDLHARSTVPLPAQRDPADAAAAWRDSGGHLVVDEFASVWGPLDVRGTGDFSLDRSLQPVGRGTLRITGYAQAIDALTRSGILPRNTARVAGTLLGLMSHPTDSGAPEAELPFGLAGGVLSAGAVPLLKLPRLALP